MEMRDNEAKVSGMDQWENEAKEIANKAASRACILQFLRLYVVNRTFSLINLLHIYEQKPDAKAVCGKRAWEHLGRRLKNDAAPILLLLPDVSGGWKESYHMVNGYDRSSTEGCVYQECRRRIAFADRVTQLTGATWELVPKEGMGGRLERGFYLKENHVFYLVDTCTKEQQEQTVLELYVDYVMDSAGCIDKLVRLAVCFVVFEFFGIKHTIVNALFGKLERMNLQEKWDFLLAVYHVSSQVLNDLEGYRLSFNETAFLNDLLETDQEETMERVIDKAAANIDREDWKEELRVLKEKLLKTRQGILKELCNMKFQKRLFSYPPVFLEMNPKDMISEWKENVL